MRAALVAVAIACLARPASGQIAPYLNFPSTEGGGIIPALLSQTGAFSDTPNLQVAAGIEFYEVNQPLWSDGAKKLRWAGIPTGTGITFSPEGKWNFPPGTVLIKQFDIGKEERRVETRFEIFKPSGGAYFLTYRWRADQTDADLVATEGLTELIDLADGSQQEWYYPSRIDCTACHNDEEDPALGPNTRQLNRTPHGAVKNQLADWNDLGLFTPALDESAITGYDKLKQISDPTASLETRVRAYLDVNCAVCHNPVSSPAGADFDARFNTPLAESQIINGRIFLNLGIFGAKVIKAQDPVASITFHRFSTDDEEERMPPLGRKIVHQEARDLLLDWLLDLDPIASLDITGFFSRWNFEDTLTDEEGTNDGTLAGASFTDGITGRALDLPGGGVHVDLPPFDLPENTLAFSLWVWSRDISRTTPFIAKANGTSEADTLWSIGQLSGGGLRFRLKTGGVTTTLDSPIGILPDEQWVYISATYDGLNMRIYLDGSEVTRTSKFGAVATDPAANVAIGSQPTAPESFSGLIDDLRIYGRALSPTNIDAIQQLVVNPNEAPTATINAPASPLFVLAGEDVQLSGSASDPEDGNIASGVTWYSSLDGQIGTKLNITTRKLSVGSHKVVFTANDDQSVASSVTQQVTVAPGFTRYVEEFGVTAETLADTDDDDLTQLLEYAFDLNPKAPDAIPFSATESGIRFPVSKLAIDLEYVVQSSVDLTTWTDGTVYRPTGDGLTRIATAGMEQISQEDTGDTFTIVERSSDAEQRFHRILVRLL